MELTKEKIENKKVYNNHCLTIGDLVRVKSTKDVVRLDCVSRDGKCFSGSCSFYVNELEPIQLTREILEKNEFKKKGLTYINDDYGNFSIDVMPWGVDDLFCLTIISKQKSPFHVCVFVRTVSKLQEVLRACRFVSLADTFVV